MILMDARVLGRIWTGQIVDRDPQIEAWAADTAPDVGALRKLLSTLDDQRLCGRKYGLSDGVRAGASEGKGTLVGTPRAGPRRGKSTT